MVLEAYDGEVSLEFDENLISNKFAVKLCLDYEVKKGKKIVKKELIIALNGELYFLKFIINPEEDDYEPGVILGRSFLRLAYRVVDFDNGGQLLDFNFDDVSKFGEELPPFICKMGKSNHNKKRTMEKINLFYQDIGPSSSAVSHLTQEEVEKEALVVRINQNFALLEEERPVIKTMAYNDKYKKILDEIRRDKVELDRKTVKEEEDAVKRIKGEALKGKDDPAAFIFPIRLERKVNKNAVADTGSDINTMPYQIYEMLGREEMKNIDKGITMINLTQAKAMGKLSNVLCQVGVTPIIAKILILGIPIDCDAPFVVVRGFLYTMGSVLNTPDRLFSTFDGVCHQTFRAARFDVLRTANSASDDEEEYVIKRNKFEALIYGLKPVPYLNYTNLEVRSSAIHTTPGTHKGEARSSQSKRPRQYETVEEVLLPQVHHEFLLWEGCSRDSKSRDRIAWGSNSHLHFPGVRPKLILALQFQLQRIKVCIVTGMLSKGCLFGRKQKPFIYKLKKQSWSIRVDRLRYSQEYWTSFASLSFFFVLLVGNIVTNSRCDGEIDDMLRIRVREAGSDEEIFTFVAWIRAFNINEPIYAELCHDFYSTYEFDEVCVGDELQSKKIIRFRLSGRAHNLTLLEFSQRLGLYQVNELEEEGFNVYFEGVITYGLCQRTTRYYKIQKNDLWLLSMFDARHQNGYANVAWKCKVLTKDVVRSLSALIYCRDLDTITLRDLIDSDGKLIPEDP
uniref:Reverse transcriptase domain-containing protein n=1 Tax=Tanacetum cinerariifolium TaxID=118510 RepID=A0A699GX80_TANCI|nr:hypothetical protein [Tanacetum cinerariifolium]